ncbi:zinc finger CCCH domain-containing protein 30-like [Vicia villosa]|uniref:zinc finger CCCH domain-containing protein 30-like n=1 Tax=Vicia villosa TaxID=3911 RepID=UPI00273BE714|nr:zinc finger CCCH domain-containing protein 30-like [Vicia villosa]
MELGDVVCEQKRAFESEIKMLQMKMMCCELERLKPAPSPSLSPVLTNNSQPGNHALNHLTVGIEYSFVSLLDLAANKDVEGFKRLIEFDATSVDEIGLWSGRRKVSKQMLNERRTPLMVAAT